MSEHTGRKRFVPFLLSFTGGILVLGGGLGRVIVHQLVFAPATPSWLKGLVDQGYVMLQANGFNSPLSFDYTVPIEIASGALMLVGAAGLIIPGHRMFVWAMLVIAFSYASLAGSGGFLVGAILGMVGGSLAAFRVDLPPNVRPLKGNSEA